MERALQIKIVVICDKNLSFVSYYSIFANTDRYFTIFRLRFRYDMTMMDQHIEAVPNVYTADDLKVDCCVLTQNSRYVVTGSANGPPQVWDMQVS